MIKKPSKNKSHSILVTGASSELGSAITNVLLKLKDLDVRAMLHRAPVNISGCKKVTGNLKNKNSLIRCLNGIDMVIHVAALTKSTKNSDYFEINTNGTKNLIDACLDKGVKKIIYISSAAVSSNNEAEGGPYSQSKLEAEKLIKDSRMKWLIIRPSQTYGHQSSGSSVDMLIWCIKNFIFVPVIGDGTAQLSPVLFDDLVQGITSLIISDGLENETIILAGPQQYTYNEFIDRVAKFYKVKRIKIHISATIIKFLINILTKFGFTKLVPDQVPRLLSKYSYDIFVAKEKISYSPCNLEEGLKKQSNPN